MANPYTSSATAQGTLSNVRGFDPGEGGDASLDEAALSYSSGQVVGRVLRYAGPHAWLLLLSFACTVATSILQLYVPILVGRAIDTMVGEGRVDFASLSPLLAGLVAVVVAAAATQWLASFVTTRLAYETVRDLRNDAYDKLDRLPLSFVDSHSHGDLLTRVVNDVDAVGDGVLQGLTQLFSGIVTIVATIGFMLSLSVPVALVVIVLTPLDSRAAWAVARFSTKSFASQQRI